MSILKQELDLTKVDEGMARLEEGNCPLCGFDQLTTDDDGNVICLQCIIEAHRPCNIKQSVNQLKVIATRIKVYELTGSIPAFNAAIVYNSIPKRLIDLDVDAEYVKICNNESVWSRAERDVVSMAMELKVVIDTVTENCEFRKQELEEIAKSAAAAEVKQKEDGESIEITHNPMIKIPEAIGEFDG